MTYQHSVNRIEAPSSPFSNGSIAMPDIKFPPSLEIKRAIAAVERAGIAISSVETHPRKIIIFVRDPDAEKPKEQTYAQWKDAQRDLR